MNRIISVLMLLTSICAQAYDFQAEGFNFDFGTGEEVTLVSPITPSATVVIPGKVTYRNRTFDVTKIANYAFYNKGITTLVINEGVNEIGERAFSGNKFKNLIIPNSVNWIGEYAFADNDSLKAMKLGKGIVASPYARPLRHTFANCDNIDLIILQGEEPIQNFNDYPAFTKIVKKFAQVYVPVNGIMKYDETEWKSSFSLPLIAYIPEGEEDNVDTLCVIYSAWKDAKIEKTIDMTGMYLKEVPQAYGAGTIQQETPTTLSISMMPYKDQYLVRLNLSDINKEVFHRQSDMDCAYAMIPKGEAIQSVTFTTFKHRYKILVEFDWFKQKQGLFKKKSVKGCKLTVDSKSAIVYMPDIADSEIITFPEIPAK